MQRDANSESPASRDTAPAGRRVWVPAIALVLLGIALYVPRLGASGLWDPWEPRYAQAAREMAAQGEWMVPRYREAPRLNRPPMTYWLIGASQALGGVNETTARLPSALLAVLAAVALGSALAARGRSLAGFMAGAALLTAPQWALLGRFATLSMPHASFLGMALSLVLVLPAVRAARARRAVIAGIVLLVAAAGLSDFPRGLLLPVWAVLGWGALRWSWKGPLALLVVGGVYHAAQLGYSMPWNLVAAALAVGTAAVVLHLRARISWPVIVSVGLLVTLVVAAWFLVAHVREPGPWSLFRYKYAFNLGESRHHHTGPYHTVVRTLAIGGMPWSAAALVGLIAAFRRPRDEIAGALAGAWLGGTLFFTLSAAQMGHFTVVVQPAVAGLAGLGIVSLIRKPDWSAAIAAAALLGVWFAAWQDPRRVLDTATVKSSLWGIDISYAVVGTLLAWALAVLAVRIGGREIWTPVSILPPLMLCGMLTWSVVPRLAPNKSLEGVWEFYLAHRRAAEPIGLVGPSKDSLFYYSDNAIERLDEAEEIDAFLAAPSPRYLVGPRSVLYRIINTHRGQWTWPYMDHPTHKLVRFEPLPDAE